MLKEDVYGPQISGRQKVLTTKPTLEAPIPFYQRLHDFFSERNARVGSEKSPLSNFLATPRKPEMHLNCAGLAFFKISRAVTIHLFGLCRLTFFSHTM